MLEFEATTGNERRAIRVGHACGSTRAGGLTKCLLSLSNGIYRSLMVSVVTC
uniref:Uncharacterized protein n=1 Tax=Oryza brachyantha TaxID=4533 RepID=J3NBM1_ORYBR